MKKKIPAILFIFWAMLIFPYSYSFAASPAPAQKFLKKPGKAVSARRSSLAEGRYLVRIGGCNDCHTRGWMTSAGDVPEAEWLTGDVTGWSGPWGTTYAVNLRLLFRHLTEDAWVKMARNLKARPPMPWYSVRIMKEKDLRAIYRLVKHLGPKGEPAPSYMPPGSEPKAPCFRFVPPRGA
jgi:mono/diheme cytochrome c family protein